MEGARGAARGGEQLDDALARHAEMLDREPESPSLQRDVYLEQGAHAAVAEHLQRLRLRPAVRPPRRADVLLADAAPQQAQAVHNVRAGAYLDVIADGELEERGEHDVAFVGALRHDQRGPLSDGGEGSAQPLQFLRWSDADAVDEDEVEVEVGVAVPGAAAQRTEDEDSQHPGIGGVVGDDGPQYPLVLGTPRIRVGMHRRASTFPTLQCTSGRPRGAGGDGHVV